MKQAQYVTLEGRNTVHDALLSSNKIISLMVSFSVKDDPKVRQIIDLAKNRGVEVKMVDPNEIEKQSESKNSQGVMGVMRIPEANSLEAILIEKRNANILLLNRIDYEQNLGAILRTAWASGVDAVVSSPNGVHEITPVVAKVSMGGAAYVPVFGMSLFQAIKLLHKYAVPVIGVEVGMGKIYYDAKLTGPTAFLMGGESEGLSEPLIKECDSFVHIPMVKEIASLNVSVATALVLFEKRRQESIQ